MKVSSKKLNKQKIINFNIISLFPEAFSYFNISILKRAQKKGIINIKIINPRDFSIDKHKKVDDRPYGGGPEWF